MTASGSLSMANARSVEIVALTLSDVVALVLDVVAAVRCHSLRKMAEHLDSEAAVEIVDNALFHGRRTICVVRRRVVLGCVMM